MRVKQPVDPDVFHISCVELRIHFNQTRAGDCWNSGKMKQHCLGEFYFVSAEYECSVFCDDGGCQWQRKHVVGSLWSTITHKDYSAACFDGGWLQQSCSLLDEFFKIVAPIVKKKNPKHGK